MKLEEIRERLSRDDAAMAQFSACRCATRGPMCFDCSKYEFDLLELGELREMEAVLNAGPELDRVRAKIKDSIPTFSMIREWEVLKA